MGRVPIALASIATAKELIFCNAIVNTQYEWTIRLKLLENEHAKAKFGILRSWYGVGTLVEVLDWSKEYSRAACLFILD